VSNEIVPEIGMRYSVKFAVGLGLYFVQSQAMGGLQREVVSHKRGA
jgi:hypothetical protein